MVLLTFASVVNWSVSRQHRKRWVTYPQMAGVGHKHRGLSELLHGIYKII